MSESNGTQHIKHLVNGAQLPDDDHEVNNRTIDRLQRADDSPVPEFKPELGAMVISLLLDKPHLVNSAVLKPDYFDAIEQKWVIGTILNSLERHGVVPTRSVLRAEMEKIITEDDPYEAVFAVIDRPTSPRDVQYVQGRYTDWIKHKIYGMLYDENAVAAYARGDFATIDQLAQQAAGLSTEQREPDCIDVLDLLQQEIDNKWLVDGVMLDKQPLLVGGKDKCLKTGLVCDLVFSLATGTPFLNTFAVPIPRKVLFVSAESGADYVQRRMKALIKARRVTPEPGMLTITFRRPALSSSDDLLWLSRRITETASEVCFIDPLYTTLLVGDESGAAASDIYAMGQKFATLDNVIAKAGATSGLCHHYKKSTPDPELGLDKFSFTGAGSFARTSLHIGRRLPYSDPQHNQMKLMVHGPGVGCTYYLDIDEGDQMDTWGVSKLHPEHDVITLERKVKANEGRGRVLQAIRDLGACTITAIKDKAEMGYKRVERVLDELMEDGAVEKVELGSRVLFRLAGEGVTAEPSVRPPS